MGIAEQNNDCRLAGNGLNCITRLKRNKARISKERGREYLGEEGYTHWDQ